MPESTAVARVGRKSGSFLAVLLLLLAVVDCGSGSSTNKTQGPLAGNWQLNLTQNEPNPHNPMQLSVSGFLSQSANTLTGSVQVPPSNENGECAGVGALNGTVNGQNVTLTIAEGGTTINLNGTLASDGKSMTGNYSGLGGGCFTHPTSGIWTASLIPPLDGNFTGTITNSSYMTLLTGVTPPAPITVSGTLTQVGGPGSSNATLTGTISAVDYPCFTSASLTGTISGQNVYLLLFGFDGTQLGTIGVPPGAPALVQTPQPGTTQTGISLVGSGPGTSGLALGAVSASGSFGPCPPLQSIPYDQAAITLNF